MINLSITFAVLFLTALWAYWKLKQRYSFWKNLGVPGPAPSLLIGNGRDMIQNNRSQIDLKWSRQFGKMYGYYLGVKPNLLVSDPELIKQILIKDFSNFVNRQEFKAYHEIWNRTLLISEDENWKRIRSIVTPAFTSGKLKSMHHLMNRCIDKFVVYLDKVVAEKNGIIADSKEVFAGFAIDVIASTSFATETNANDSRETTNPIVTNGKLMFVAKPLKIFFILTGPKWFNDLIGIKTPFGLKPFEFFINLMSEIMRQRKRDNVKRNDLVQLLIDSSVDENELKNLNFEKLTASNDDFQEQETHNSGSRRMLTDKEIIAQCIMFFAAGFETTASTLFHVSYELAKNPEVQEKLFQVLTEATTGLDKDSDEYFDKVVNQVPYLEATIKETLRMYPPIAVIFRRVNTDGYNLAGVKLPKNLLIETSTYSVHHNPVYYPEPETFKPDRFMPENKEKLVPYTYLPFGAGPRNCVGMRFAYQEIKLCLATIVKRYRFEKAPGTPDVAEFSAGSPLLLTKTFPIKIVKR